MKRRDFVRLGWATMFATGAAKLRPAFGKPTGFEQMPEMAPGTSLPITVEAKRLSAD